MGILYHYFFVQKLTSKKFHLNFLAAKKDLTLEDILSSLFWITLLYIKVANCS